MFSYPRRKNIYDHFRQSKSRLKHSTLFLYIPCVHVGSFDINPILSVKLHSRMHCFSRPSKNPIISVIIRGILHFPQLQANATDSFYGANAEYIYIHISICISMCYIFQAFPLHFPTPTYALCAQHHSFLVNFAKWRSYGKNGMIYTNAAIALG